MANKFCPEISNFILLTNFTLTIIIVTGLFTSTGFMENIYHEEDRIILLHVVEQLHLPFLAGMKTISYIVAKCSIM